MTVDQRLRISTCPQVSACFWIQDPDRDVSMGPRIVVNSTVPIGLTFRLGSLLRAKKISACLCRSTWYPPRSPNSRPWWLFKKRATPPFRDSARVPAAGILTNDCMKLIMDIILQRDRSDFFFFGDSLYDVIVVEMPLLYSGRRLLEWTREKQ